MANVLDVIGNPILPTEGMGLLTAVLEGTAQPWGVGLSPLNIHLYQNDPPLGVATVLADLVESVFSGYAEDDVTDMTAVYDTDGTPMLASTTPKSFIGGSPLTVPGSATGYYLTDTGDTVVVAVERFADSFPFNDVADRVNVYVRLRYPGLLPT